MNQYIVKDKAEITLFSLLKIPFQTTPILSTLLLVFTLMDGIMLTLQIQVTSRLINSVLENITKGQIKDVKGSIVSFCLILGYNWISKDMKNLFKIKVTICICEYLDELAIRKVSRLKYYHIENSDSQNLISRVKPKLSIHVSEFFYDALDFVSLFIKIIGILLLIFTKVWWASILIVILLLPLSLLVSKSAYENYKAEILISENTRRADYFKDIASKKETVDERILFGFGGYINEKFKKHYNEAQTVRFKVKRVWFVKMKSGSLVSSVFLSVIIFSFLKPVITKTITVGFFISISQAIFSLIQRVSWELTKYIDSFATMKEFKKEVNHFFKMEEDKNTSFISTKKVSEFKSLQFINVSFCYPETNKYVLRNLSFTLDEKKCYAFVGANGSGKTTIIKLLAGLYDNYSGYIKINGIDIKEYKADELRSMVFPLFQDYARYQIPFKDNILLGDIANMDNNEERITQLIDKLDMSEFVRSLPNGMDTNLGRVDRDSVDISGGQWQRISILRALINTAPVKILDEPTASLDPISESNLYQEFNTFTKNNTTILISHRLGATKLADKIYVLKEGTIAESGTHEELLNKCGVYSKMFQSQKAWYV